MHASKGFTLVEALITTLILVTGLAAVAAAFSYGVRNGERVRQQTAALALISSKMEDLRGERELAPGRYSESLSIAPGTTCLRTWEITAETPRRITVVIYGRTAGQRGPYLELSRATTAVAQGF